MLEVVTINGRALSEFQAKMQSYPTISSSEPDVEVFQGSGRSSFQLLQNRRGAQYLTCLIDFISPDNARRTQNRSAFEALFLGSTPVVIDIGDSYLYRAALTEIRDAGTEKELITTVEYQFRVTRQRETVQLSLLPSNATAYCRSNVEKTDCLIRIPAAAVLGAPGLTVWLNGLSWSYPPALGGDLVLDGVNKIFTVGGENATNQITWTDFPYLVPGENKITVSTAGVVLQSPIEVTYTPVFL